MKKTIRFNTGRKYTDAGQRIVATLHDDGIVTFADHDRGIDGEFELIGKSLTAGEVMAAYDGSRYKSSKRSWSDHMQHGGCNSKVNEINPSHGVLLETFERELARQWTTFDVKVHSFQVVKEGYIVIYDLIPSAPHNPLGEYERLAFFNKALENRNDIILR